MHPWARYSDKSKRYKCDAGLGMGDRQVDAFRARYRQEEIGVHYSSVLHLALTTGVCLAGMAGAASGLAAVARWEWLTVPLTFLFANVAEHAGHRGPMHHRRRELDSVFKRHTGQHHRFFTHERMSIDVARDAKAVLVPPVLALFFIGFFVIPVSIPLALLATRNVACLFAFTGIAYVLIYEWLHFAYHVDERSWIAQLPGLDRLRRHHATHHNPTLMSHYNFNITFPIADRLFGTYYRTKAHEESADPRLCAPAGQRPLR